jgi:hypothetical protein
MGRMARHHQVVVQFDGAMLRAIEVDHGGRRSTVTRAIVRAAAEGLDGDAAATGRWIAESLGSAGFEASAAVWAIGRESFALRALELPRATPAELPGMVRLAMHKEPALESVGAVIDFLALPRRTADDGNPIQPVLAAGLPAAALERLKAWSAASLAIEAIVPRFLGAIELADAGNATVAIFDATGNGLECSVVRAGAAVWSRAASVQGGPDALVAEAKRTWLAFRLAEPTLEVADAIVFGDGASAAAIESAILRVAGVPARRFDAAERIQALRGVDAEVLAACLSLVGIAHRSARDARIDFAAPRKAPDLAAARRRRVLVGAGVAVLAALGGWTLGNQERKSFFARVEDLREKATAALPEYQRFKRDTFRLKHLETWASVRPDWLDHASYLHGFAPDAKQVVLDQWNGSLEISDVEYGRDRRWKVESQLKVTLDGEARDRGTADAFREALVEDRVYTLSSTGADGRGGKRLGSPFSYLLRTGRLEDPAAGIPPSSDAKGGGP